MVKENKKRKWETKKGRPLEFDADKAIMLMQEEINNYVNGSMQCYEIIPVSETKSTIIGKAYPQLFDISVKLGVSRETLTNHCTAINEDGSIKNKQLFDTYIMFKELGETMLVKGGLSGVYDGKVVQFIGNVNYGMIPKQQVEQSVEVKSMELVYAELDKHHAAEAQRVEKQKQEMIERKAKLDKMEEEQK